MGRPKLKQSRYGSNLRFLGYFQLGRRKILLPVTIQRENRWKFNWEPCKENNFRKSWSSLEIFKESAYFDDFVFLLFCSFLKIVLIFFLFFPFPSSSSWSCCATFSLLFSFWSPSFCSLGRLPSLVKDNGLASLDSGSGALVSTELFPLIVSAVLESENCFYWAFKLQESDLHRSFESFFFLCGILQTNKTGLGKSYVFDAPRNLPDEVNALPMLPPCECWSFSSADRFKGSNSCQKKEDDSDDDEEDE